MGGCRVFPVVTEGAISDPLLLETFISANDETDIVRSTCDSYTAFGFPLCILHIYFSGNAADELVIQCVRSCSH